jgi:hypothetical protein
LVDLGDGLSCCPYQGIGRMQAIRCHDQPTGLLELVADLTVVLP